MTHEECALCGSETGKAGPGDGSIFIGGVGPLCEDCYDEAKRTLLEDIGVTEAMPNRIALLEAALRPFADAWPGFQPFDADAPDAICGRHTASHGYVEIRRSDFKQAYEAMNAKQENNQ